MASVKKSEKRLIEELHQAVKLNNAEKIDKVFSQTKQKFNLNLLLPDQTETVLTEAIKGGDIRIIEVIIEKGADVHAKNFSGKGPLHLASYMGNHRVMNSLLQHGADVNNTDNTGRTGLHWAVRKHDHVTDLLLKKGADINQASKDGNTALHDASECANPKMIQFLIDNKADVTVSNENGQTTCYMAAKGGNLEALKVLVKQGADVYALTQDNETFCHVAAANGHLHIIQYLVENHNYDLAWLNKVTSGGICKIQGRPLPSGGWTVLHFACAAGHAKIVEYLMAQGVNTGVRSQEEITPKDLVKIYKHQDELMPFFTKKKDKAEWKNI